MSSEALAWAFKQDCKSSSVKFTLVALCECANYRTGRITPSIEHLCEITGQNRKTIISNVAELEQQGLITDTGERVGRTKQIKVYQADMGSVPKAERSQKRNSSENGRKQSQKRDTEPSWEPSSNKTKGRHPLPANWEPREFGAGTKSRKIVDGWPPGTLDEQVERFGAHHRKLGNKFDDWQAAWSTWVLNWKEFNHGDNIRRGGGQRPDKRSGLARAIDSELGSLPSFP
jgi:hypothetical protein